MRPDSKLKRPSLMRMPETTGIALEAFIFLVSLFLIIAPLEQLHAAEVESVAQQSRLSEWSRNVERARKVLAEPDAKKVKERISALEQIRLGLAAQRDLALAASRIPNFEARIVQGRLRLLGPVPPEGESDFAAAKRQELEENLYELEAPQRALTDSYLRTATTIELLDEEIEALRFEQLVERGQSPLWPGSWLAFLSETPEKSATLVSADDIGASPIEARYRRILLTISLVIAGIGMAVVTVGRRAALKKIYAKVDESETERKSSLLAIGHDFGGLVIAVLGIAIIAIAGVLLIALFPESAKLPALIFLAGLPIVLTHWLAITLFSPSAPKLRLVDLGGKGGKRAVWLVLLLGIALAAESILEAVENASPYSAAASGVAPLLVLGLVAGVLYLLARTIEKNRKLTSTVQKGNAPNSDDEFLKEQIDWTRLLTGAMKLSALISFLLALAGYSELARFIILPTIESMVIATILVTIYVRVTNLVHHFAPERLTDSQNTITAIKFLLAIGFLIVAAPIIALLWGVRPAEILDLVVLMRDGVTLGGTTISIGTIFVFIIVFVIGYVLTRWIQRALQTMLLARLEMDPGTRSAVVTGTGYVGVMLAFVAAIGAAGIDLSNLAIIFGALSVGIGFGMQSVVSNFVSGIIMLIERPIKEGDTIEVGGYSGIVDKISVRATRIQSFDHDDVIIPNSELIAGTVRNRTLTDRMTRIECSVGIAYDSDVNAAFDILQDIAKSHERSVEDPPPTVVMEQLGDSALMLRLYCFIDEVGKARGVISEMYVEIVRRFAEKGISIPFPQREIAVVTDAFNATRPSDNEALPEEKQK